MNDETAGFIRYKHNLFTHCKINRFRLYYKILIRV